jgi:hypothetical protein
MLQLRSSTPLLLIGPGTSTAVMDRVRGEFREMPGLSLTLAQASRLWALDNQTCRDVLTQLVDAGFLHRRHDGAYCCASKRA